VSRPTDQPTRKRIVANATYARLRFSLRGVSSSLANSRTFLKATLNSSSLGSALVTSSLVSQKENRKRSTSAASEPWGLDISFLAGAVISSRLRGMGQYGARSPDLEYTGSLRLFLTSPRFCAPWHAWYAWYACHLVCHLHRHQDPARLDLRIW
jgi:hypothetical protein